MSPRKAQARRPRRLASAAAPCRSKMRTPIVTPKCPAAGPLGQPTCRVVSPNAAAAAASVSPAAAHPDSPSIVSAGPGSGDTEVSRRNAPHRPHQGSYRVAQAARGCSTQSTLPAKARLDRRRWAGPAERGGASTASAGPGAWPLQAPPYLRRIILRAAQGPVWD